MIVVGIFVLAVFVVIALGLAGLMVWSAAHAFRDELQPSFKMSPPGPGSITLTLLGVVAPVALIVAFALALALQLVRLATSAL